MPRHATLATFLIATAASAQPDVPPPYRAILQAEAKLQAARDVERGKVEATLKKDRKLLERMKTNAVVRATLKQVFIPEDDNKPVYFQSRDQKLAYIKLGEAAVAKGEARVAELTKPARYEFKDVQRTPQVGDFGYIAPYKVLQVIDKNTAILVKDFIEEEKAVQTFLMLKNHATEKFTDNQTVRNYVPMVFSGTTMYRSVSGNRTVLVVEPIDMKLLDSYRAKQKP